MSKFSLFLIVVAELLLIVITPPLLTAPIGFYHALSLLDPIFNASLINGLSLLTSITVSQGLASHPQRKPSLYILPICMSTYGLLLVIVILGHFQYSAKALLVGFILAPILLAIFYSVDKKGRKLRLYCVPSGDIGSLKNTHLIKFKPLTKPSLPSTPFNGVVVDFRDQTLKPEWEQFLSECALKKVQIYNYVQLNETITGKANVKHLAENNFGDLAPSEFVMASKRVIDLLFLVLFSPIIIPLVIGISIWIMVDSEGGPFFIQERLGLGGKHFKVIKFRSMLIDHSGSLFTEKDESHRITRVGRIIRKYRIDEIPQFWNVLKGEMSLIGPRPESIKLAEWYQKEVPFFMYRHVVPPGISGWAQVMHGYAGGVDETREKLAYDLYYIKHFSLWLDLLIWYKTIRTVLTGFGSR